MFRTIIRWIRIADSEDEFPLGKITVRYAAGRKLCLAKTQEGLFAIEEKCPHNGFSLAMGWCTEDGKAIVCPLHRYVFEFSTGRARSGTGAARVFPVEVRGDGVFLGVEEHEWGLGF
ncbi:MAG TPA: Rieske 2Fe-2S domain-containing protein [Bacteroidia bacterium]|nr:Rieske 2Fe-2S domain-containing protein [Bacteroidia bacterium]